MQLLNLSYLNISLFRTGLRGHWDLFGLYCQWSAKKVFQKKIQINFPGVIGPQTVSAFQIYTPSVPSISHPCEPSHTFTIPWLFSGIFYEYASALSRFSAWNFCYQPFLYSSLSRRPRQLSATPIKPSEMITDQQSANLILKVPNSKYFRFCAPRQVTVATTQFCLSSTKQSIENI